MERLLTCTSCGDKTVVTRAQAGQVVNCSKCNSPNQVPTLRGLAELPLAAEHATAAKSEPDTWGWRGPLMAICLAGLLFSVCYAGFKFYIWSRIDVQFDADLHVQSAAEQMDQASLDTVLYLWDDYSKASLGSKQPPAYKQWTEFAKETFRKATISSAFACALALVATGTLISAKKAARKGSPG